MTIETYLAFFFLSLVFMVIPGPTVLLVISQTLSSGKRSVIPLAAGVGLGDLVAMTLSFMGIGATLATSALLFTVMKGIGAVYLVYLGIRAWRAPIIEGENSPGTSYGRKPFLVAFLTTALNPKSIIFFVAFLPQFVSDSAPLLPQFILLGATYLTLGVLNAVAYAVAAGRLRTLIRGARVRRYVNRAGGSAMVFAGLLTAMAKRN